MEALHEKVLTMVEEFQEWSRLLKGEITLLKRAMVQSTPIALDLLLTKV